MRDMPVVEWRARSRVPRQPAVLCEGRRLEFDLHGQIKWRRFCGNSLPKVDEVGEDLNKKATKTNKPKMVKTPSKSKTKKALPVKAWEKLKGRGPFPSVAAEGRGRS